jgi:hypothetical protein
MPPLRPITNSCIEHPDCCYHGLVNTESTGLVNWVPEVYIMNIEIRDPSLEARLKKQLEATESGTVEEALRRLLETQEEQDRWLLLNRGMINEKIQHGLEQLDHGEIISEDQLDVYLAKLKNNS